MPRFPMLEKLLRPNSVDSTEFDDGSGAPLKQQIGMILVDQGHLDADQAEQVLNVQRQRGGMFGDIAVSLGLCSRRDIQVALGKQNRDSTFSAEDRRRITPRLLQAMQDRNLMKGLRNLRTQLELRWFDENIERRSIACVSANPREGRTTTACLLALLFAQTGRKVILFDACTHRANSANAQIAFNRAVPRIALGSAIGKSIALPRPPAPKSLRELLREPGRLIDLSSSFDSIELTVIPGLAPEDSSDVLSSKDMAMLLEAAARRFDIVLVDTPACRIDQGAIALAVRTSGALICARLGQTSAESLGAMSEQLADAGVEVVAVAAHSF